MKWCGIICLVVVTGLFVESVAEDCTPGETKHEDCNTCKCLASGKGFACTRRQCLRKREAECVDGTHKTEDCQECNCIKGGWACTRNICKGKRETGRQCEPNTTFQQECNTCRCSPDGKHAACTFKACIPGTY